MTEATVVGNKRCRPVLRAYRTPLRSLCGAYRIGINAGAAIGSACIGAVVIAYAYEVIARYVFNSPTSWANAVTVYLTMIAVMLMLPYVTRESEHVSIDFVNEISPAGVRRVLGVAILVVSAVTCFLAAWFALEETIRQYSRGVRTTDTLQLPKWLITMFLVYGLGNAGVLFTARLFTSRSDVKQAGSRGV